MTAHLASLGKNMSISPINPITSLDTVGGITTIGKKKAAEGSENVSFGAAMKSAIKEVNNLQQVADQTAVKLATGDVEDVHKAMLAMNKAKLAFDFTLQVRNKVVDAYQEIMRMQV